MRESPATPAGLSSLDLDTMPNNGIIKDAMLPRTRVLEARKTKFTSLHHTASAPSLEAMASKSMTTNRVRNESLVKMTRPQTYGNLKEQTANNWRSFRRTSLESGGSSESGSGSSSSSTPNGSAKGHQDELSKQIGILELELKERTEKLDTANERLSDRELEISILQKRLELRSKNNSNSSSNKNDLEKCLRCSKKDGIIINLFEKLNIYESAILGSTSSKNEIMEWDMDVIMRNVEELNKLVAENERSIEYIENGAKFLPTNVMHLSFYADGFQLDNGRFRPYSEKATKSFMKDLSDGFFPTELQVKISEKIRIQNSQTIFERLRDCAKSKQIIYSDKF